MERLIGRKLTRLDVVHHANGIPSDDRPENLVLTNHSEHRLKYHPDIGKATRRKPFPYPERLILEYHRCGNIEIVARMYSITNPTVERLLKRHLGCESLREYARSKGWPEKNREKYLSRLASTPEPLL
jgi:hypothetical protein